jgi:hypothetical protein
MDTEEVTVTVTGDTAGTGTVGMGTVGMGTAEATRARAVRFAHRNARPEPAALPAVLVASPPSPSRPGATRVNLGFVARYTSEC